MENYKTYENKKLQDYLLTYGTKQLGKNNNTKLHAIWQGAEKITNYADSFRGNAVDAENTLDYVVIWLNLSIKCSRYLSAKA